MVKLRQLLAANSLDIIFLYETKLHTVEFDKIKRRCECETCFVVNAMGRRGGLALMWKSDWDVNIQSYSANHIDTLVTLEVRNKLWVTGFYGFLEP